MNVKRAKTAGFCFGVKRAVETVYEQAKNSDAAPIYTYGPIIHNEEVVKDLENQGVIVLRTEQELEQLTEGTVIIRSHGVAKYIYEKLEKKKIQIAESLLTPAHLYLWDEPLNYVDVFTRMQIEEVLLRYEPTMLIVEHDARFRERIATKIVEL